MRKPFSHDDLLPDEGSTTEYGVTFHQLASAICIWASLQAGPPSVAECAGSFNATARLVCDAIRHCDPAFLRPQFEEDPAKQFIHFVDGS